MKSLFERVLFEADGDDSADTTSTNDNSNDNTGPPDISDDSDNPAGDLPVDDPPDVGDDYSNADMDIGDEEFNPDDTTDNSGDENLDLDEKISTVMNANLYQKFLSMIGIITNQLSVLKNNNDVIYASSPEALGITESLKKLRENINLYLAYYFINNNYSKNLLFFNKCLNLLNLLNKDFVKKLKRGINE